MAYELKHIHTYLVPDRTSVDEPEGVSIPLRGKLFEIATAIFTNERQIPPLNVNFIKDNLIGQTNEVRTMVMNYGKNGSLGKGMFLANRLKEYTTLRSKVGLLMLIRASEGTKLSVCVCRFPAEEGIMANKTGRGLKVEFIEKVFLKDAHSFKSVRYDDVQIQSGCWFGQAIDRQINDSIREVSDYWIKGFLKSDYQTKPKAGTIRLAQALKKAIANSDDASVRTELISAGVILRNYSGKVIIPTTFFREARLSDLARVRLAGCFPSRICLEDAFILDLDEYDKHINLKSIELDNGAIVMAPLSNFTDIVTIRDSLDGKSIISSEGRILRTEVKGTNK